MKILFIGAVQFSASVLKELIRMQAQIVGVCTIAISTTNADKIDLSLIAREAKIPVRLTSDINDIKTVGWMLSLKPDIIFCFGWSQLIKSPLLEMPPMGIVGYHPTALPANRGRHPLIWALVLGLTETASTFFFMDDGADSGDIISQRKVIIEPTDNAKTLYEKITLIAIEQLGELVPSLAEGKHDRYSQDHQKANTWRKRVVSDGIIDWRMAAETIHNLVRGLTHPYIGAHFIYNDNIVKVWRTEISYGSPTNCEPGKVLSIQESGILVKAGTEAIRLCEVTPSIDVNPGDYL